MKRKIEERLSKVLGQPFLSIGRAGNLLWLCFGENIVVRDRNGNEKTKSTYALNIQCAWRVIKENKIIVASGDFYLPKTGMSGDDAVEWDKIRVNRFDEKIDELKKAMVSEMIINGVLGDEIGGLCISFDSGIKLEIFPNDSLEDEFWRFIEFDGQNSEHFVVFDKD